MISYLKNPFIDTKLNTTAVTQEISLFATPNRKVNKRLANQTK